MVFAVLAGDTSLALVGAAFGATGRPEIFFRRDGPVIVVFLGDTGTVVVAPVAWGGTTVGRGRAGATAIGPQ